MITNIDLTRMRNDEFIQFMVNVAEIANLQDTTALLIKSQTDALQLQAQALDEVFKKQQGSDTTAQIKELDKKRDFAIIGIRSLLEAYSYHYDNEIREGALVLKESLAKYGDRIYDLNYQAETTTIRNLVEEWKTTPHLAAALSKMTASAWVDHLDTTNTEFNTTYLERNTELSEATKVSVTSLREGVVEDYRALTAHITAHATLNPAEGYTKLINQLNTLIDQYKALLDSRTKRADTSTNG